MAVSEAMAASVPVITSNRCGMPYMVEDDKSGYLIEPNDGAQIVDRLNRVLGDANLRRSLGARGREIARARFHPHEVARKTLRAYQSVIEKQLKHVAARPGLPVSHKIS
jgi:glycosyltransferase involved in cell wall biosynthesis